MQSSFNSLWFFNQSLNNSFLVVYQESFNLSGLSSKVELVRVLFLTHFRLWDLHYCANRRCNNKQGLVLLKGEIAEVLIREISKLLPLKLSNSLVYLFCHLCNYTIINLLLSADVFDLLVEEKDLFLKRRVLAAANSLDLVFSQLHNITDTSKNSKSMNRI